MAFLKTQQMQAGASVWMILDGGGVRQVKVVAVKATSTPTICFDDGTSLFVDPYAAERFYPSEKEAYMALAMLAQREASKFMGYADAAFKKAGTAKDEPAEPPADAPATDTPAPTG